MIGKVRDFLDRLGRGAGETVYEDDFKKPDSTDLIPGWLNGEKAAQVQGGALVLNHGWIAASKEAPGDLRLEFNVRVQPGQIFNLGGFIHGTEGFWSGYELYLQGGKAYLRRAGILLALAEGLPLEAGKDYEFFLARMGSRVTAGLAGKTLMEVLDLEPLAQENQCRFGVMAFSTQARFLHLRATRPPARDKVPPLAAPDRLFAHRKFESALLQYKSALPVLDAEETSLASLKSLLCLHRLGRSREALESLKGLDKGSPDQARTRLLLKLRLEFALAAADRDSANDVFSLILGGRDFAAERQALAGILGRSEMIWKRRELWAGARAADALDHLILIPDLWTQPLSSRGLLRFAQVTGQGGRMAEICERVLSGRVEARAQGKDLGELHYQRAEALAKLDGRVDLARLIWDKARRAYGMEAQDWSEDHALPLFELEKLWGTDGSGLRKEFLARAGSPGAMLLAYAFVRAAEYAWSRGAETLARELFSAILDRLPLHGTACCSALLNLASMDLHSGDAGKAEHELRRVMSDYPREVWAAPFVKLALGRYGPEDYRRDMDRDKIWTEGPRHPTPFMLQAAWLEQRGQIPAALDALDMVQGLSFPWEPAHALAGSWIGALGGGKKKG